ncbi:hypothetical protein DOTSEDRAFT_74166 [Dothistroma septosporum NZE10]|uniref:Uncharacterized protein n=1 Tax=Dothistroma septosporum (strain NZE10 / CBS 128990) TaxID=675120 RepID=N1PDQ5_DOTSN|nr:hypothetical protein DOTSEDRAFT_74166 [Dothistroma septosporum NZE10]
MMLQGDTGPLHSEVTMGPSEDNYSGRDTEGLPAFEGEEGSQTAAKGARIEPGQKSVEPKSVVDHSTETAIFRTAAKSNEALDQGTFTRPTDEDISKPEKAQTDLLAGQKRAKKADQSDEAKIFVFKSLSVDRSAAAAHLAKKRIISSANDDTATVEANLQPLCKRIFAALTAFHGPPSSTWGEMYRQEYELGQANAAEVVKGMVADVEGGRQLRLRLA